MFDRTSDSYDDWSGYQPPRNVSNQAAPNHTDMGVYWNRETLQLTPSGNNEHRPKPTGGV